MIFAFAVAIAHRDMFKVSPAILTELLPIHNGSCSCWSRA